ncbi:MAG TPA: cytochrome c3 family protein, partial [Saprospiraceae bacterium]|nr:cytochrome c3 family protein [Saprospiraceae bacterium]
MIIAEDTLRFHHSKTNFPLKGQHKKTDCRSCHETLVFSEANSDCISCHTDVHNQTVGNDCARCHTFQNWLIDDVTNIHFENGFPLAGVHASVSCNQCHVSETNLRFERIGNDCISCHLDDYVNTKKPNHQDAGFSTNCLECHDALTFGWSTEKVDHSFFPLTKGHETNDCAKCHTGGDFSNTPANCFACHQVDFESATNPNHLSANFSTDCTICHTTDPDWMPAQFVDHDANHFPIYSGVHAGQWTMCKDCHSNESDYAVFSCTVCHLNPETDVGHTNVNGYIYENT